MSNAIMCIDTRFAVKNSGISGQSCLALIFKFNVSCLTMTMLHAKNRLKAAICCESYTFFFGRKLRSHWLHFLFKSFWSLFLRSSKISSGAHEFRGSSIGLMSRYKPSSTRLSKSWNIQLNLSNEVDLVWNRNKKQFDVRGQKYFIGASKFKYWWLKS